MIRTTQDELIEKLSDLRGLSPDVRFGQLLANLAFLVDDHTDRTLWEIEDAELLGIMENHRADLLSRQQAKAASK